MAMYIFIYNLACVDLQTLKNTGAPLKIRNLRLR